jgi:hypothetical protein
MIELLVLIAIIGLIAWLVQIVPIPEPIKTASIVVVVLLILIIVIRAFGLDIGMPGRMTELSRWTV